MSHKTIGEMAVHCSPDFDALFCVWLLKKFGEERFPGVSRAKIIAWPAGKPPEGLSAEEWLSQKRVLAVDVGLGVLDHHHPQLKEMNESSADLVAQAIGRIHYKPLQNLLVFCRLQDRYGKGYKTHGDDFLGMITFLNMLRGWNLMYPADPAKVVEFGCAALDGIFAMEFDRFQAAEDAKHAVVQEVVMTDRGQKRLVRVAYVESKSTKVDEALRRGSGPDGKPCQVCIVHNPVNKQTRFVAERNLDLKWALLRLRVLDAWYRRVSLENVSIDYLTSAGAIEEVPGLYSAFPNLILNGSLTNPTAEPLAIFPDRLLAIVCEALVNALPGDQPCTKDKGCSKERCPFFAIRLRRCGDYRRQRWEAYQQQRQASTEAEQPGKVIHLDERKEAKKEGKKAEKA